MAPLSNKLEWQRLSESDFNRIVEALLVRHHRDNLSTRVYALDGRGGDNGVDVAVEREGAIVHVYQLKYFPEGFSGGWGRSRRPQIKKSFARAIQTPTVRRWTLVVPGNGTIGERKSVFALRAERPIELGFLGRAELDGLMALYPDIHAWATREPLVDTLRLFNAEKAALQGSDDLTERVSGLAALADSRSAYWGVGISVENGTTMQTLHAKRPDAAEKEPLSLQLTSRFGPDDEELRKQFVAAMEWGATKPLTLPTEVVQRVGPEWFAGQHAGGSVELVPATLREPVPVELRVVDDTEATVASLIGQATKVVSGRAGGTIEARFRECLTVDWRLAKDGNAGEVEVTWDLRNTAASDANAVLRLTRAMTSENTTELWVTGQQAFATTVDFSEIHRDDQMLESWYDDLAFLEHDLGVTIAIPDDVSALDRLTVRIARMVREGRCTLWPGRPLFTGTLNGALDDTVRLALSGPHMMAVTDPDFAFELAGRRYRLGEVQIFHPQLQIEGSSDHLRALEEGRGEGRAIRVQAADDSACRIYSRPKWANRWGDAQRPLVPERWGLPGVEEDPSLQRIQADATRAGSRAAPADSE